MEKKKLTYRHFFFCRRIPNVGHGILGYQDSLASFYLSVCDVSSFFYIFDWTELFSNNLEQNSPIMDMDSNNK